jgi:hypothetical protein
MYIYIYIDAHIYIYIYIYMYSLVFSSPSQAGRKVLVVEAHSVCGGCATWLLRGMEVFMGNTPTTLEKW